MDVGYGDGMPRTATRNRYGAERRWQPNNQRHVWKGWVSFNDQPGPVTFTPGEYRTKADAMAAIRGQHPQVGA